MGEVLIITPCVGVDLYACVRKREKERGEREEETMCQHHHPLPGSVARGWEEKEEETERGGRDLPRQCERGRRRWVCVCPSISVFPSISATPAYVGLHLRTESASITGEAIQRLGRACQPLPSSTKRVNLSGGSAPWQARTAGHLSF